MRRLSVLLAFILLLGALTPAPLHAAPFQDVAGTPFERPVAALAEIGVVQGTSPTLFDPHGQVTRAQMAALLVRALRLPRAEAEAIRARFNDVSPDFWAFADVMLAEREGIVAGLSESSFGPNLPVTHGQAVTMAVRALGYDNGRLDYPAGYVAVAAEAGLLDGLEVNLDEPMSRGEVAILLANAVFRVRHGTLGETLSQALFRHAVAIAITPDGDLLNAGVTSLEAVGLDAYGNTLPAPEVQWRLVEGAGAISTAGLVTVSPGTVTVEATAGGLAATRTYRVVPALSIHPPSALVRPGDTIQLSAVAADTEGEAVGVTWTVLSGPASISDTGLLRLLGSGTAVVQAAVGTSRTTASFTSAILLRLHPAETVLTPGESQTFAVIAPDGRTLPGPFEWSVEGPGSITPEGRFTAGFGSSAIVRVQAGELTGAAAVHVAERLTVTPSDGAVTHRTKPLHFAATALTAEGKELATPVTWSVAGAGRIDQSGIFTPTEPGEAQVTASFGILRQTVSIAVSGDPQTLELTADRSVLPANGSSAVTLTAMVRDARGVPVAGLPTAVEFELEGAGSGAFSADSVSTDIGAASVTFVPPSSPGTYRVVARAGALSDQIEIVAIAPVIERIRLEAAPPSLPALPGSQSTVAAVLVDSEGIAIPNGTGAPIGVSLFLQGGTGATLDHLLVTIPAGESKAKATLTAGLPGTTTVTGLSIYPVESATVRASTVGSGARLTMRTSRAEARADGTDEITVTVEARDGAGALRLEPTVVILTAVSDDGRTPLPTQRQTTEQGAATFRLRTEKAGRYDLTAAAAGLVGETDQISFLPGPASSVQLSAYPSTFLRPDGNSTLRLRAEIVDAHGNLVTAGSGTITFAKVSGGRATATAQTVMVPAQGGVAELEITATYLQGTDGFQASVPGLLTSAVLEVTSQQ